MCIRDRYINDEITVKMGVPILESQNIPTTIEKKINSIPSHEFIVFKTFSDNGVVDALSK